MNDKLKALKLVLDAMGVGASIGDVNKRKEKQKAIYLAKLFGIDLGYSYGWYVKGPYCPKLADDYYELNTHNLVVTEVLVDDVLQQAHSFKEIILNSRHKPSSLDQHNWLELLASWHYLKNDSKYDNVKATAVLALKKRHVSNYIEEAEATLAQIPAL